MKKCVVVLTLFVMLTVMNLSLPAGDEEKKKTGESSCRERLQLLSAIGGTWNVLNLIPGMLIDRQDVGGNESGNPVSFYGSGANAKDTTWYIDGVNISHPAVIGSNPAYLDPGNFEEIQVSSANHDITSQTGGIQLNFVTRKGGSRFGGGAYFSIEDDALEMKQDLPSSIIDQGGGSPGIFNLYRYGINLAGPIFKDKLWFSGSYAMQDIHARTISQTEETTRLPGLYGKLDFRFGKTSGSIFYAGSNRKKQGMTWLPASSHDPAVHWDQGEPHHTAAASVQQVVGNLTMNVKAAYTKGSFLLDPAGSDINPATGLLEGQDSVYYHTPSPYYTGSLPYHSQERESLNLSFNGSYFIEKFLPGDHEIRFGVDYYRANTTSQTLYPNQRRLFIYDRNNPHGYKEIWWINNGKFDADFERFSYYLSDTMTLGRLTAAVGLRYDREANFLNPVTYPALTFNGEPIFEPYMGEYSTRAQDFDTAFKVFSPRVSLTYDLNGNGKNILRASYARYGSYGGNSISRHYWETDYHRPSSDPCQEIDVYWNDINGDLVPQAGEWDEAFGTWIWWNIMPYDPYAMYGTNKIDSGYSSPMLDELTLSFEKKLGQDFSITLHTIYKKESNLTWNRGMFSVPMTGAPDGTSYAAGAVETADNWYKAGTYILPNGETRDIYQRYYVPNLTYKTNYGSGTYNTYKALQLMVTKKLSKGWMADASFTLSGWKQHLDAEECFDKTNSDYFNGSVVAPQSGANDDANYGFYNSGGPYYGDSGTGLNGVYVNARWQLKVAGLVQLPFGINLTGVFHAREGYVTAFHYLYKRGSGLGWTPYYTRGKKFGDDRLPAFWMLNLGLEKTFNFSSYATATLFINGYNITNNATTLQVDPVLGTSSSGLPQRILNPGIFQFGVRVRY